MAQRPDLSRYLDAGAQFVALTRSQARARATELVGQGQLAQEQVQGFVDDLVDESRRRTDEMLDVVRREIQRQVKTLGIATKDDLARLESRITGRSSTRRPAKKRATEAVTKSTKKAAKKAPIKQTAKKAPIKKAAEKAPAKRAKRSAQPAKKRAKRFPNSGV